jgi:nucleoside-diphosphate-sugar epimerase
MLSGEKILITGPAGKIAFGITRSLARENDVWGIARFRDPAQQKEVEDLGVTTRRIDLYDADFSDLPNDFTYLVHIAVAFEQDYDRSFRSNGEGTGLLLEHCRKAKAALVMSSCSVYRPNIDPFYAYRETDPLGDPLTHIFLPYPVSKISQEVVARYCARSLGLPVVIARMNAAYGLRGGLPAYHMADIAAGKPVVTRWDPCPYTPIFDSDIEDQLPALLDTAGVPANIVNWGGDEVVTVQEWAAYAGELLSTPATVHSQAIAGGASGMVADNAKRLSITGPCKVSWREGFRRTVAHRFPDASANRETAADGER